MKKNTKLASIFFSLILIVSVAVWTYLSDYYPADSDTLEAMTSSDSVTIEISDNMAVFSPALPEAGFLFYPGGKVEYSAYAPLMHTLAENNVLCVIFEMPFNLAVLDIDAAEGMTEEFPEVTRWFIGGHSLGGSMAAAYAAQNPEIFSGLVLLASYSTEDLSDTGLKVISLYGTEDCVLNWEKYNQNRINLPESAWEIPIKGGNHAFFGNYGLQDGDGKAAISHQEQTSITAQHLLQFFEE